MNKARKAELTKIVSELEDIVSRLETIRDAEQEAFDNLPESLQGGERGEAMQGNVAVLDEAHSEIEAHSGYLADLANA